MIKKTFHTNQQNDCFDGCVLYIEERCDSVRQICAKDIEDKFDKIDNKLKTINDNVEVIKKEVGLNGSSAGKS